MLRLRLFHRDDPARQIDSRTLDEGEITIGRDAKADWTVEDPERATSRKHLVLRCQGGLVTVRDTSANGVFLGDPRRKLERDRAVPIERGEAISFGNYVLVAENEDRSERVAVVPAASPFGSPAPSEARGDERAPRGPQPFGSALKSDPMALGGTLSDQDAWDSKEEAPAGSWASVAPHRKPDHSKLIGSERTWSEPEPPAREEGYGFDGPFNRPILEKPAVPSNAASIPSDWMNASGADEPAPVPTAGLDPVPVAPVLAMADSLATEAPILPPPPTSAEPKAPAVDRGEMETLFEHFCAGAGLSPAAFAGEDRNVVMERLGGVYRQAVLGIADLMQERTALRNEYRMVHTTVRPQGNNPFKWVPPQRIAVELLRGEDNGYVTGAPALADALHDLKAHLLCMLAGMRAALGATFDALSPQAVEARVASRNYLIRTQRDAALWIEYVELAERLRAEADDNAGGMINRAFRQAYEEQAAELGGGRR